jgi:hypothetical protein
MSTPSIAQAILSQAIRQVLSDTFDDHDANLLRNLPPNFPSRITAGRISTGGGTFEAPGFLSSPLPPLGYSRPGASSAVSTNLSNLSRPAVWKSSEDMSFTAVQAENRRMEWQAALIREAQQRHALRAQQTQRDSYLSFLRATMPVQTMAPSIPPHPSTPVPTTTTELSMPRAPSNSNAILKVLGSTLRGRQDPYIDISGLAVSVGGEHQTIRGGVAEPFPQKLYRMLLQVEEQGKSHIVSFSPHGRAFAIHDIQAFTDEILPKYFDKQSKLISFIRQLNLYGFVRIHAGLDSGGYYHELFLKGRPDLFSFMRRTGASHGKEDRRKRKDRQIPAIQPDFYAMQPIRR